MHDLSELTTKIAEIKQEIANGVEQLENSKAVYEFKKNFLDSKNGKISQLMKEMKDIPTEGMRFAMCVIATGPMLVVFPFFQKYFTKGLTVGAVKG